MMQASKRTQTTRKECRVKIQKKEVQKKGFKNGEI
jgi:hypothetical protein